MPNKPFGDASYQDRRTVEEREEERRQTDRQGATLLRRARENEERRRLVNRMRDRRSGDPDSLQLELVPREGRLDVVAASGRLQILAEDFEVFRSDLADLGITVAARSGNVLLLDVPADTAGGDIAELTRRLRATDIPVSLDYVAPLGGWVKGEGGPAKTAGSRDFPSVQIEEAARTQFVAVLDSGVSNAGRTDGYLGPQVVPADVDPLDVFPQIGWLDGDAGHGSMVIGIVQQVVPTARVGSYRVADTDGVASSFDVAQKMRIAALDGAQILNLSLGTGTEDDTPPPALLDVVDELARTHPDLLIVCAAGNDGDTNPIWPAAFAGPAHPNVVAVAALDAEGVDAPWSTHGPWVTCSAIGQGVGSTYVVGREDGPLIEDPNPDTYVGPNPWAVWSGTSFAAPQVAGAIARICAEEKMTPQDGLRELESRATPAADPSTGYGWTVEILPGT